MQKYTAIIVEDDNTTRMLMEELLSNSGRYHTISSHNSALSALNDSKLSDADVLFLDVEMPGLSGTEFARSIQSDIKVVFTTSESKYAVDAFGVKAFDFVLKPVDINKLIDIANYLDNLVQPNPERPIFLKTKDGHVRIDLNSVFAISAEGDYVCYLTKDKKHLARQSMTTALETCKGYSFIQVHRSHIVNLDKVTFFRGDAISLDEWEVPISRSFKDEFLARINKIV